MRIAKIIQKLVPKANKLKFQLDIGGEMRQYSLLSQPTPEG